MKRKSMAYLIRCYMEKVLPEGFRSFVRDDDKSCRVEVGTKEKLLLATTIHHPTELLSQKFQNHLRQSIDARLNTSEVNYSLTQRLKRFEARKRTAKQRKDQRFVNAYELQKRETESNRLRSEAKARNAEASSRKANGFG